VLLEIRDAEGQCATHRVLFIDESADSVFLIDVFRPNPLPWSGSAV